MSIRKLSPELSKKAIEEINEDPLRIAEDIETIKSWLQKQPHIKARTDDQWLVGFLRGCKYSLEKTKKKLDFFYTMKTTIPELAVCVDPLDTVMQEVINAGIIIPLLKTLKPDDPRVVIVRPGIRDVDKIPITAVLQLNQTIMNWQILNDDQTMVAGQMYIIDMSKISASHIMQMTPSLIKKMTISRQEAFPFREKGMHPINVPSGAEKILSLIKFFANEKNKSRFILHTDVKSLYKYVPKVILPIEYGGENGTIQENIDFWKKELEKHRDWFIEDKLYKTDESKRLGTPKTFESIFGMEGSFRQLHID